ncbi:MAG: transcription antitermination factor NusB [Terriglobia bacterium]
MPISVARSTAYRILRRVESASALAVDPLQSEEVSALREVDRALVTELVMGVLRWRGELDFQIERLSGKRLRTFDPEVVTILRLGLYQIGFLERIPVSAAVNEAVELVKQARKRSATGLVNAVLRKGECGGERPTRRGGNAGAKSASPPESADLSTASAGLVERACRATPEWLLDRWTRQFGFDAAKALALASVSVPPTALRVTGGQTSLDGLEGIERELAAEGIIVRAAQYAHDALVVESGRVQASKAWREGRVVIQDEASQLVATLLRVEPGQRVLDLAAAPGIKTAQIAGLLKKAEEGRGFSPAGPMPSTGIIENTGAHFVGGAEAPPFLGLFQKPASVLVACDVSARRLADLNRLLPRHVPPDVRLSVVRLDATDRLPFRGGFDRVLLDAPCSGTGTLSRNPEIKWRLRPEDVTRLAENQAKMLRHALEVLAPDGRLVYATCSLEREENEEVVERVLKETPGVRALSRDQLRREITDAAGLIDADGYFRTRPDLHGTDGFFAAVLGN